MANKTEHDIAPRHFRTIQRGWVGATRRNGKSVCTPLYMVWVNIRRRCRQGYRRGIHVCAEWNEFAAFRAWALSHGYQSGRSIDRIDNDGDYEPTNCRWANATIQARNRSNNVVNEAIVREIRASDEPPKFFREKYGLDQRYVWEIRTGRVWKYV